MRVVGRADIELAERGHRHGGQGLGPEGAADHVARGQGRVGAGLDHPDPERRDRVTDPGTAVKAGAGQRGGDEGIDAEGVHDDLDLTGTGWLGRHLFDGEVLGPGQPAGTFGEHHPGVEDGIAEQIREHWREPVPESERLFLLANSFALADDDARALVNLCLASKSQYALPSFPWLADSQKSDFEKNNLRLLYARVGKAHCHLCGKPIEAQAPSQIVEGVMGLDEGLRLMVLAPLIQGKKGHHREALVAIRKQGFVRARIDGDIVDLRELPDLDKNKQHVIEAVVDRLVMKHSLRPRLTDTIETALVTLQRAGIALVVFPFAELCRIDEYRDHDALRMFARRFNEVQMTFMQVAHGWHQRDVITRLTPVSQLLA